VVGSGAHVLEVRCSVPAGFFFSLWEHKCVFINSEELCVCVCVCVGELVWSKNVITYV